MERAPRIAVVLLPGMDGTDVLYGPLRRALPASVEPVVVEYATDGRCGYDEALATALAAIDALGEGRTCHCVGWSFSGPVALRAARARPDRVRSVSLVASFVQAPTAWLPWLSPLLVTPVVGIVRTIRRLPIWLGRAPHDPLRRDKAELWRRVPARTLARRARAIAGVDARGDLQAVRQPVQYLVGSDDGVVPPHNLEQIRMLRPDVEATTLAGDHFALYSNAARGAAAIADFAHRHAAARPSAAD